MKCEWSKLDKIKKDCEKVNLKSVSPTYFKVKSTQSETSGKKWYREEQQKIAWHSLLAQKWQ